MSDAVSTTGILVKRKASTPPSGITITSSSVANPTVITTAAPHGRVSGDTVTVAGHTGSTPAITGSYKVTVIDATHFSIPVTVTVGGTGGTATAEYVTVAEITNVDPGGKSRNKIETSTHNEGKESHVLGILRQDDPTFEINLVGSNATHQDLNNDMDNNIKNTWRFEFPSGITRTGDARVQKFKLKPAPVDGVQGADLALSWAGTVTEVLV